MTKICFVIGGSRGLGAALVERYREEGFRCIEFSRSGTGEDHVDLDLCRRDSAIDAVDQQFEEVAASQPEQVVLLVNAALVTPIGELSGSEPKSWWSNIDANIVMPISIFGRFQYHFNALAIDKTAAFVSSGAALSAMDGWSLYCAAKAGVDHFIRTMALEQSSHEHPIKCAILDPGMMDTEMQATIRQCSEAQCRDVQFFIDRHEQGGLSDPGVVAGNVLKALAEPFENGARLIVHG